MGRKVLLFSFYRRVFPAKNQTKNSSQKHARTGRGEDKRPFSSPRVRVQLAAGAVGDSTKCSLTQNFALSAFIRSALGP